MIIEQILRYFVVFFLFLGFILFYITYFKSSGYEAPLYAIATIILIVYGFALFDQAKLGLIFAIILSIILFLLSSYWMVIKQIRISLQDWIAVFLFGIFFTILCFVTKNWHYAVWDEFSSWDAFTRFLFYRGKFSTPTDGNLIALSYPQAIPVFQYCITKILGYSSSNVYLATNILICSGLIALIQKKNIRLDLLQILLIFLGYGLIYNYGFSLHSIYADALVGVFFGVVTSLSYRIRDVSIKTLLPFAITVSVFIMMKDVCIVLAVPAILIFSFNGVINSKSSSAISTPPHEFSDQETWVCWNNQFNYYFWLHILVFEKKIQTKFPAHLVNQ